MDDDTHAIFLFVEWKHGPQRPKDAFLQKIIQTNTTTF